MNGILDSMMTRAKAFRPESVTEYSALQLAKKLGDPGRLWKYLPLFDHHPSQLIVDAFISAQAGGLAGKELITAFEGQLASLTTRDDEF